MQFLDRIIGAMAPAWGLRRVQARLALQRVNAAYDAARSGRRMQNWLPGGNSARTETESAGTMLRDRSRDLVRNNPYAAAGLDMLVAYQVGTGIVPRPRTGDAALDKQTTAVWDQWCKVADFAGQLDLYGMQAQVARSRSESGEVLVQLVPLRAAQMQARDVNVPLAIKVIEADHMPLDYDRVLRDGTVVRQGVELRDGRPAARWLTPHHPGDDLMLGVLLDTPERYPAETMLHIFRPDRPGQLRGVPDLAPVMTRLRLLDEYEDAAMVQAMVQATMAAFVTSNAAAGQGPMEAGLAGSNGRAPVRTLSPGMVERLMPGEDVKFMVPSGTGPFSEFTRHQLHAVAAGYGLTYDLLTGDLTRANYSSLRAGRLAFRRRLERDQWHILVPQLCEPVWQAFIRAAVLVGTLPGPVQRYSVEWGPPRFEMVDPLKDAQAIELMRKLGLLTFSQAASEQGRDPVRQVEELASDNTMLDSAGLVLAGDARHELNAARLAEPDADDAPAPPPN